MDRDAQWNSALSESQVACSHPPVLKERGPVRRRVEVVVVVWGGWMDGGRQEEL